MKNILHINIYGIYYVISHNIFKHIVLCSEYPNIILLMEVYVLPGPTAIQSQKVHRGLH